jgi:hypothetical protein
MSDAHTASIQINKKPTATLSKLAAAAFIAALSAPATAALYGGVGSAMVSSDLGIDQIASISGTTNGLIQDDPREALRFFGGYSFGNYLSVEGGYNDIDTVFAAVGSDTYHFDITGIDISALGRLPLFKFLGQPIGLYVKAGIINWTSEIQVNQSGSVTRFEEDGTDFLYGGGVEVLLFRHFLVRGGLDVLDIDPSDAGAGNITLGGVQFAFSF